MRARLARIGTRGTSNNPVLEPLFRAVRTNHPKADLALLERAYGVAERMHEGQMRKSGDPYITHPLAVTTILAELGKPDSLIKFVADRPGHDRRYAIDDRKIERELGWVRTRSLDEGLRATVRWYLEHPAWVAEVRSGEYRTWYERNYAQRGAR